MTASELANALKTNKPMTTSLVSAFAILTDHFHLHSPVKSIFGWFKAILANGKGEDTCQNVGLCCNLSYVRFITLNVQAIKYPKCHTNYAKLCKNHVELSWITLKNGHRFFNVPTLLSSLHLRGNVKRIIVVLQED